MNESNLITQLSSKIYSRNYELSNSKHDEWVRLHNIDITS